METQSPQPSGLESQGEAVVAEESEDTLPAEDTKLGQSGAGQEEEADSFRQLQKEIQMLNSDVAPEVSADESAKDGADQQEESSDPPPTTADPSAQESEEDPAKERESMIKAIYHNRRQSVAPAVRRGTELAWKILTDPATGVELPPVTPPDEGEEAELYPPGPPLSAPSATSPNNGLNGSGLGLPSVDSLTFSQRESGGTGVRSKTSPVSLTSTAASTTSPKNGLDRSVRSGCRSPHAPPQPPVFNPLLAAYMARAAKKPSGPAMPERLSTHVQTLPPYLAREPSKVSESLMFGSRLPAPPTSLHAYECPHCDMAFKDHMMHSMHMTYHKETGNPYECRGCGYVCKDKVEFFLHIARNPHS